MVGKLLQYPTYVLQARAILAGAFFVFVYNPFYQNVLFGCFYNKTSFFIQQKTRPRAISRVVGLKENLINDKYKFKYYEISKFYGFKLLLKIISDKVLSLIFLISFSPLISISMLLIYLEDGFPLFFTQDRTGWDGRRFKIYKLRSLKKTNFDKTVQVQAGDNRLLKIGKFIRRFSIDELPQFYNVLIGDMSIVGPRPHMVEHDILYSSLFKNFLKRHKSNPGLTGWAQINSLRGATPTPEHMRKRMEYDLWYLSNWTLWLDYFIILKTFYVVFKKND